MGSGLPQGTRTKLVFVVWAPQSASIKQKMVSASSKDALKKKLDGVQVTFSYLLRHLAILAIYYVTFAILAIYNVTFRLSGS